MYRASTTPDVWGNWTQATAAAGFATTAGSNQMYQVFVRGSDIAALGFGYGRLSMVELVDSPVLGGINCAVSDGSQFGASTVWNPDFSDGNG